MSNYELVPGDTIFASVDIYNDGSFPETPENALLVKSGTRGVIINEGHLEHDPNRQIFLVKFEQEDSDLGPAVGCWPEDIRPVLNT